MRGGGNQRNASPSNMGGLCSSVVVEDDHSQIIDTASIETKKATTNIKNAIQTTTKGQETPMKAEQKEDTRSNEQPPLSEEEVEVLQLIKYSTICILRNLATALGVSKCVCVCLSCLCAHTLTFTLLCFSSVQCARTVKSRTLITHAHTPSAA